MALLPRAGPAARTTQPPRTTAPPAALIGLGRVALGQGRPAEALMYCRPALAVQHRNAAVTAAAIVYAAEALLRLDELAPSGRAVQLPAHLAGRASPRQENC